MMYLDSSIAGTYLLLVLYLFTFSYCCLWRANVKTDLRTRVIITTYVVGNIFSSANWIFYVHDDNGVFFSTKREYLVEMFDLITVEVVVMNL